MTIEHVDCVVVGAGLSGLYAARHLARAGVKVVVFEAAERLGGRVDSCRADQRYAYDRGAQWISNDQPRMMALAQEAGIALHPTFRRGAVLVAQGNGFRRHKYAGGELSIVARIDLAIALIRLTRRLRAIARANSAESDDLSVDRLIHRTTNTDAAATYLSNLVAAAYCSEATQISALELAHQLKSVGGIRALSNAEQWIVSRGASQFVDWLASDIRQVIRMSSKVTAIEQGNEFATVTAGNATFRCQTVILAIAPHLYRHIAFSPQLPDSRTKVLGRFVRGHVVKSVAIFEKPWWRQMGLSGMVVNPGSPFPLVIDSGATNDSPGVLVCLSTGSAALVLEPKSEAERTHLYLSYLSEAFASAPPEPIAVESRDWFHEPFAEGGYASFRGLHGWRLGDSVFHPHGRIHFAATETAHAWRSYMEGAVNAGFQAAQAVTEQLQR